MSAGGSIGPNGITYWESTEQKILQQTRGFVATCANTTPDLPTLRNAALAILYQTTRQHLLARMPDAERCEQVRRLLANTTLRSIGLSASIPNQGLTNVLTNFLLSPLDLGGGGIPDPIIRACQDIGTALLGGLMHKNRTVRQCTEITIQHATPNPSWMLTEQGDNTPVRRLAVLRNIAGLSLHAGNGKAPPVPLPGTNKPAIIHLRYQLSPKCTALLGGTWGNQWVQDTDHCSGKTRVIDSQALLARMAQAKDYFCVDMCNKHEALWQHALTQLQIYRPSETLLWQSSTKLRDNTS